MLKSSEMNVIRFSTAYLPVRRYPLLNVLTSQTQRFGPDFIHTLNDTITNVCKQTINNCANFKRRSNFVKNEPDRQYVRILMFSESLQTNLFTSKFYAKEES